MRREAQSRKGFTRRALILAGAQASVVVALAARLYQLQILERDRYTVLADENRINLRLLAPPRGRIVDRFGAPLASNRHNYRVVVVPEQDFMDQINANTRWTIGLCVLSLLLAMAIGTLVTQRVIRSLQRLTKYTRDLVAHDFKADEEVKGCPDKTGLAPSQHAVQQRR